MRITVCRASGVPCGQARPLAQVAKTAQAGRHSRPAGAISSGGGAGEGCRGGGHAGCEGGGDAPPGAGRPFCPRHVG